MPGVLVPLIQGLDANRRPVVGGINPSKYNEHKELGANTAESIDVPTGARWVLFNFDAGKKLYADYYGGTASVPSADTSDGSSVQVDPALRYIEGKIAAISVICSEACDVDASFWS
jgi:hypothetical protein